MLYIKEQEKKTKVLDLQEQYYVAKLRQLAEEWKKKITVWRLWNSTSKNVLQQCGTNRTANDLLPGLSSSGNSGDSWRTRQDFTVSRNESSRCDFN